jgi:hypothetical protein
VVVRGGLLDRSRFMHLLGSFGEAKKLGKKTPQNSTQNAWSTRIVE